jgi:hypothetical protein
MCIVSYLSAAPVPAVVTRISHASLILLLTCLCSLFPSSLPPFCSSQPCLSRCTECNMRNDTCCPGFHWQQSGRLGKSYCLPDCVPYKPVCSAAGGVCGLTFGGNKCCKGLDCIVGKDGQGICAPRNTCEPLGSPCGGFGECQGGLYCAPTGKCETATCRSTGKKFSRSALAQTSKNVFHYQCQSFFNAASSGSD